MNNQTIRQSNIEILRIIAMFMILLWHAWGHFEAGLPQYPFHFIVGLSWPILNIHVDLFVLISGYFGLKLRLKSLLMLYTSVLFYTIILFTYSEITNINNGTNILSLIFPLTHGDWWFIRIYVLLLFISPLLNIIIDKCNINNSWKTCLFITCGVNFYFSYIQEVDTIYHYGYDLSNFICLYFIGRYIYYKKDIFKTKNILYITFLIIILKIIFGLACKIYSIDHIFRLTDYCNPLNVLLAATVFYLVVKWRPTWKNRIVNNISTSTLSVYLITDNSIIREQLKIFTHFYFTTIPIKELYLPTYLIILIMLFFLCILIDKCRIMIMKPFLDKSIEYIDRKNLDKIWKL